MELYQLNVQIPTIFISFTVIIKKILVSLKKHKAAIAAYTKEFTI